jgi:hypothetical protein
MSAIEPIQDGINEPGRRYIPLPGSHSLATRGDTGILEIGRFGETGTRKVMIPIAVSDEVAEILERMAEGIHAELKARFEVVTDSVYHLLDHQEDIGEVLDNVRQALDFVDDPTAAMANLMLMNRRRKT